MADANSRICVVYGLFAKSDEIIRYVGQTVVGANARLRGHLKRARISKTPVHRDYWIRSVIAAGDEVGIVVLQDPAERDTSEREWISLLKSQGADLVNLTAGGDGMLDAPPELRKRISDSVKKLWESAEYRAKAAGSRKGVPWSAAQFEARMSVSSETRSDRARRGRQKVSPERRSEISALAAKAGREKHKAMGTGRGETCSTSKLTDDIVMEMRRLRASGTSGCSIARMLGMSPHAINCMLRGVTWSHLPVLDRPDLEIKGERIHNVTLTEDQVMDIRTRAAAGESMPSIGLSYGKHRSAIRIIVTGLTWKHLPVLGNPNKKAPTANQ